MKHVKAWVLGIGLLLAANATHATQIRNVVELKGSEQSVLNGIGVVVGLNGTGDGAEFNADRTEVTLYITDNGEYDDDTADGVVRDPSGLGSSLSALSAGSNVFGGGGGGGCFIQSVQPNADRPLGAMAAVFLLAVIACFFANARGRKE